MTVTCPYCKKKFHKGKTNEFGRMSKHIWKEHKVQQSRKIKRGLKRPKEQLEEELQWTDDMIIQSLREAGIPLQAPQYAPPMQYQPQHQVDVGLIIQGVKLGIELAKKGEQLGRGIRKYRKKQKAKK